MCIITRLLSHIHKWVPEFRNRANVRKVYVTDLNCRKVMGLVCMIWYQRRRASKKTLITGLRFPLECPTSQ